MYFVRCLKDLNECLFNKMPIIYFSSCSFFIVVVKYNTLRISLGQTAHWQCVNRIIDDIWNSQNLDRFYCDIWGISMDQTKRIHSNSNFCWTGHPFVFPKHLFFSLWSFLICVYLYVFNFVSNPPPPIVHISFYIYSITCLLSNVIVWNVCEMEKL